MERRIVSAKGRGASFQPSRELQPHDRLVILDTIDDYYRQYGAELRQSGDVLEKLKKSQGTKDSA
jgi:hypothetical protein